MAVAIRSGCDVEAWVIGKSGFVPNYERLLEEFPYPDRLLHRSSIPRAEVPGIFSEVDVMSQPSDDEDFGSSVAEALACGVPAIVGCTNGTSDYICGNSIKLKGDDPEEFAEAILMMATAKKEGKLVDRSISRNTALRHFNIEKLGIRLEQILLDAANSV
jgi:glycosyltransferase involved in cell wall biosynthesis